MKQGFVKVAAVTPKIKVADTIYNGQQIRLHMDEAVKAGAKVVVFPELCITGCTCGDLFFHDALLRAARKELFEITEHSQGLDAIFFVGLPYEIDGKLYNMAAVICGGEVLGLVPKTYIPGHHESYETRYFASGAYLDTEETANYGSIFNTDYVVPVGTDLIFCCASLPKLRIAVEIGEDLMVATPPSTAHALSGATVIANLSAFAAGVGADAYCKKMVSSQSARLHCGYILAAAGEGESTQDLVFKGGNIICENGNILAAGSCYDSTVIYSEVDVERLEMERRSKNTFEVEENHIGIGFDLRMTESELSRNVDPNPFVPADSSERSQRCEEILTIQALGLKKRMEHTYSATAVIGISGGLDSTLALLVTARAFDLMGKDRKDIVAVTMPGFGTTDRTYDNAIKLIQSLGATFREISIRDAVNQHFADIGHDPGLHNVTYENSQARERTQILMDVANQTNGLVIGTGDLSELALGWATYNGDHMSNYAVNASIPKTLVRYLVSYYADTCGDELLSNTLKDVLDTPVSPELLPPSEGKIAQITEDLVGPYELHDFFMYYVLRMGYAPAKIYRLAKKAFAGTYTDEFILKWLKTFFRRFFMQQFKRSCLPDGPKVGSVGVSPRGDLRMPSDACVTVWMKEIEEL